MVFTPPKNQIPDDWLKIHGLVVREKFLPALTLYQEQKICAAELCMHYVLGFLKEWRGDLWHSGDWLDSKIHKRDLSEAATAVFTRRLRGVSLRAQRALQNWFLEKYPIELSFRVLSSMELLALQAQGRRVVTIFTDVEKMSRKNFARDPMTFVIHDLEHADEFFHDPVLFEEQKSFYQNLNAQVLAGEFTEALRDKEFKKSFEYVISDMNSHPAHLQATLDFLERDYACRTQLQNTTEPA